MVPFNVRTTNKSLGEWKNSIIGIIYSVKYCGYHHQEATEGKDLVYFRSVEISETSLLVEWETYSGKQGLTVSRP